MKIALLRSIAVSAALVFGLVGCAAAIPTAKHSARPAEPETCGAFLKLSDAQRHRIYDGTKKVTWYATDGVKKVTVDQVYAVGCLTHKADDLIINANEGEFPECSAFATLSPDIQQQWMTATAEEFNRPLASPPSAADYIQMCTAFDVGNLVAAGNLANRQGFAPSAVIAWTTGTKLGYTEQLGLAVGTVLPKDAISDDVKTAVTACGYDASTDAIVPLFFSVQDTTKDAKPRLAGAFSLAAPSGSVLTTATIAGTYTSGSTCTDQATPYRPASIVVSFDGEATSQVDHSTYTTWTGTSDFWVVVKNYFSPRNPAGTPQELAQYTIKSGVAASTSDDPVVQSTGAAISLAGMPAS